MSKNDLSLKLGGNNQRLKFNLGTLKHIGDITSADPLNFSVNVTDFSSLTKDVVIIVHAALLSNYDSAQKDLDFTGEDVRRWVMDLDMQEVLQIVQVFSKSYALDKEPGSGEGATDTREQALNVAGHVDSGNGRAGIEPVGALPLHHAGIRPQD